MQQPLILANARLAEAAPPTDLLLRDGVIARIGPALSDPAATRIELAGGLVWPCFADLHTHLDKGHIWPRAENPDGSFGAALAAVATDRAAHWRAEDVHRRAEFGLRCAYAHGTRAIRTHLDSLPPQYAISWPVFAALRAAWAGRIDLQAAALFPPEALDDMSYMRDLVATVARHGGLLGGVLRPVPDLPARIELMLRLATDAGLDLDLHVDETLDPAADSLPILAAAARAMRFPGRIVAGHCCSLSVQPEDSLRRTAAALAEAGIGVVSLPMCNLYLQDRRPARTPRRRGVTALHELAASGVAVAVASDNCRHPFYAYGDHDMLEVFREAVRIAHLDRPYGTWADTVSATPLGLMGLHAAGIAEGAPADLVAFRARSMNELLARPQSDRIVIRNGAQIATQLPDYAELDESIA